VGARTAHLTRLFNRLPPVGYANEKKTASAAIAPKPTSLSYVEAASIPVAALTAWQALFDKGNLTSGQTVLIDGAAGGVGMFAVQLAKWKGAKVIATASTSKLETVRALGADETILRGEAPPTTTPLPHLKLS
jgi:NADPH:quinone reductase-like Zn-dependent oxidoreductase